MARLEREPWPGFSLSGGDIHAEIKAQEALLKEIEAKHTVARFPVADGYALYAVMSESPLVLKHIPFCDAYQAAAATIRGFNLADLERQKKADAIWKEQQDKGDSFYASLRPGQVVHYDHGFKEYVRCEVVVKDGKNVLKPVALVGEWREHDLPRRHRDGTVELGYHVKMIRDGETMSPHPSNIFEYERRSRRDGPDPSKMEPVDLSVPGMDAEQERVAALWQKVEAVRDALKPGEAMDPAACLERARRILCA